MNDSNIFEDKIADKLQQLCLHAGFSCILEKLYDNITKVIINNDMSMMTYDAIETYIDEKCPVYCLEVPSEVFYVRRNGKAVWTGNSRPRGPRTLLTRQPPEGLTTRGLNILRKRVC